MARDTELTRARVADFAEQLRDRLADGWSPEHAALVAQIRALKPRQAQAMELVFIKGLSVAAAAREMGVHHSTAQEAIARGTLNLGAKLT